MLGRANTSTYVLVARIVFACFLSLLVGVLSLWAQDYESLSSQGSGVWRKTALGWEQIDRVETNEDGVTELDFDRRVRPIAPITPESQLIRHGLPFSCATFLAFFGVWSLTSLPSSSRHAS